MYPDLRDLTANKEGFSNQPSRKGSISHTPSKASKNRPKADDISFLGSSAKRSRVQKGQEWLGGEYAYTEQKGRARGTSSALGHDWNTSKQVKRVGNKSD